MRTLATALAFLALGATPALAKQPVASNLDKVLVIGTDGTRWDLLRDAMRDGRAPNLARLARQGFARPSMLELRPERAHAQRGRLVVDRQRRLARQARRGRPQVQHGPEAGHQERLPRLPDARAARRSASRAPTSPATGRTSACRRTAARSSAPPTTASRPASTRRRSLHGTPATSQVTNAARSYLREGRARRQLRLPRARGRDRPPRRLGHARLPRRRSRPPTPASGRSCARCAAGRPTRSRAGR